MTNPGSCRTWKVVEHETELSVGKGCDLPTVVGLIGRHLPAVWYRAARPEKRVPG